MAAMPATSTAAEEATPAVFDREVVEHQDPATAVFFGCAYCSQAFPEESELEVHIRMSHEGSAYSVVPAQLPRTCSEILHSGGHKLFSEGIPMSEVERHCTPEDCWVVINGKVYDLTEFLGRHPGGPKSILAWAGKDGSEVFNHIHQEAWIQQYLLPESLLGELGLAEGVSDAYWHSLKEAHVLEIQQELIGLEQAANLPRLLASRSGDDGKEASKENLEGHNGVDDGLAARLHELEDRMHAAAKSEDYGAAAQLKQEIVRLRQGGDEAVPHTHDGTATIVSGIPLSEVRKHNTAEDCWVALNGWVYDFTDFLRWHPYERNPILAQAGRDASAMWNRIQGRFPSSAWMEARLDVDFRLGPLGPEPAVADARLRRIAELQEELRRIQGPSESELAAARERKAAAATAKATKAAGAAGQSELSRFPRLKEVANDRALRVFTREEVARQRGPPKFLGGASKEGVAGATKVAEPGTEPYVIVHNRVYDLTALLGNHPGGDEILLSRAGTDVTEEFELFEHSEKSRLQRDRELLVGELARTEWVDAAVKHTAGDPQGVALAKVQAPPPFLSMWLRSKALDVGAMLVARYVYMAVKHRKPLSRLMYSRALRHMHLLMAVGMAIAIGTVRAAGRSEGLLRKRLLQVHRQTGNCMLLMLLLRFRFRLTSGIPPRFPGLAAIQFVETQSMRGFYVLALLLPLSGLANDYFLRQAPMASPGTLLAKAEGGIGNDSGDGNSAENSKEDSSAALAAAAVAEEKRLERAAKSVMDVHRSLGKFFERVWLPFHLGYTTLYHAYMGRGVIRKVSPFI